MGWGKKGEEELWWILSELVVMGMVTVFLLQYVSSVKNDTLLEKKYLSRDIALLLDSFTGTGGEVEFEYLHPGLGSYDFSFAEVVGVAVHKEQLDTAFPFYQDKGLVYDLKSIAAPDRLHFRKSATMVSASADGSRRDACPKIGTAGELKAVMIDYDDSAQARAAAEYIGKKMLVIYTRSGQATEEERLARVNIGTDALVSLRYMTSPQIKLYVPVKSREKSGKLACLISENLEAETATAITDDAMASMAKMGVVVTFGPDTAPHAVGSAVAAALEEYNG